MILSMIVCFASSFLTLKQRNAEVLSKLPLEAIWYATEQGRWYPVLLPDVDMAQSNVLCTNQAAIVAGEEYEFIFKYWRTIIQKK